MDCLIAIATPMSSPCFRVAAGLDPASWRSGILGQLRDAYRLPSSRRHGPVLNRMFQGAAESWKTRAIRNRNRYAADVGCFRRSETCPANLRENQKSSALIPGAGATSGKLWSIRSRGIAAIIYRANRSRDRAAGLADRWSGEEFRLERTRNRSALPDVVVSSVTPAKRC